MKYSVLFTSLAVLSLSGEAMALQEGARRPVTVAGYPAGTLSAYYTSSTPLPSGACLYYVDWESPYPAAGSVMCEFAEQKVLGHTSCFLNRTASFVTTVTSTDGKGSPCMGFDQYGFFQPVALVFGESQYSPVLNGLGIFQLFPFLPRSISIL